MLNHFSHGRLFATLWTLALQALPSMGFFRQDYWSGLPCPFPGDLPHPGIKLVSLMSPTLVGSSEPPGKPFYLLTFGNSSPLLPSSLLLALYLQCVCMCVGGDPISADNLYLMSVSYLSHIDELD